jgi:hypothetical protein
MKVLINPVYLLMKSKRLRLAGHEFYCHPVRQITSISKMSSRASDDIHQQNVIPSVSEGSHIRSVEIPHPAERDSGRHDSMK